MIFRISFESLVLITLERDEVPVGIVLPHDLRCRLVYVKIFITFLKHFVAKKFGKVEFTYVSMFIRIQQILQKFLHACIHTDIYFDLFRLAMNGQLSSDV